MKHTFFTFSSPSYDLLCQYVGARPKDCPAVLSLLRPCVELARFEYDAGPFAFILCQRQKLDRGCIRKRFLSLHYGNFSYHVRFVVVRMTGGCTHDWGLYPRTEIPRNQRPHHPRAQPPRPTPAIEKKGLRPLYATESIKHYLVLACGCRSWGTFEELVG